MNNCLKRTLAIIMVVIMTIMSAPIGFFSGPDFTIKASAATNNNAMAVVNNICSTVGFRPGVDNYNDCYAFASAFCKKMYGTAPGGTSGYTLTRPGSFYLVGQTTGTGVSASSLSALLSQAMPGDVVQMYWYTNSSLSRSSQHTAIVYSADSSSFTILQDGASWSTIQKSTYNYSSYYTRWRGSGYGISLYRHSDYNNLFGGSGITQEKPTNVSLSKNQIWYDIKDNIILTPSANNATSYYMSIIKDGKSVLSTSINGEYSFPASKLGYGDYHAWITATNAIGSSDSNGVDFSIVGPAGYSKVESSKAMYSLDEIVEITVFTVCAKGQVIGIDKNGTRIITQDCEPTYSIPASKLGTGSYSVYFSVYNGSGGVDTESVSFEIYENKPKWAEVSTDKISYEIGEKVTFNFNSNNAVKYTIGIDDERGNRIDTYTSGTPTYIRTFNRCGSYSCYITVSNKYGGVDSNRIYFKIKHVEIDDKAVAATCTENGKTAGSHCSVCGTVIKAQKTVKATGHTYGAWETTKKATYTATGTQTHTCKVCGVKQTKSIAKLATTAISKCTFSTLKPIVYTGKAIAPKVTVKNGKTTLKADTHYTVSYKNNTKIGKATITIKGIEKNGYTGTKALTFNILPGATKSIKATQSTSAVKLTWSKVAGATGYRVFRYDTKSKKWVKLADTKNTTYTVSKLKAGTNYKYAVKAYTAVGKTIYWSATYAQFSTATKPATPATKVTAGKKQATVSWNKVTGATGYVVYYSTSKNGTYKKLATVKGASYTAKKLTTGKTYYFKVAAYKTVGKTNIYGSYSAVKGVKVR